eukprot:sb/3465691/
MNRVVSVCATITLLFFCLLLFMSWSRDENEITSPGNSIISSSSHTIKLPHPYQLKQKQDPYQLQQNQDPYQLQQKQDPYQLQQKQPDPYQLQQKPDLTKFSMETSHSADLVVLIVSTWRSGSSTFSRILSSHPSVWLHYEPLDGHKTASLTDPEVTEYTQDLTDKFVACNYPAVPDLKTMYNTRPYLEENGRVPCRRPVKRTSVCNDPTWMSTLCRQFPVQMVKYVRISLNQVISYIKSDPQVRVIWLARDPRAVWQSRSHNPMVKSWCHQGLCGNLTRLCESYDINLALAEEYSVTHPDQFTRVQFEAVQDDPVGEVGRVFNFLGLDMTEDVYEVMGKMQQRTNFTTKKDWESGLGEELQSSVENECRGSMLKLGYI